ncbi:MAG: GGDEF domain-containing protein, partial [Eubacteriales bacterium]|nr:GGDEF domain-containing protein [Eubacteriales bacterium]
YYHWNNQLNVLMDADTVYMGVNLSRDSVEVEKRVFFPSRYLGGLRFSKIVDGVENELVFQPDRQKFRAFFNRERLIGQFYDGGREGTLEYRVLEGEEPRWFRAEVQLISEPSSGHIKASIVLKNVDEEIRERERLKNEAEQDAMTEIYNHAAAERRITEILARDTGERCCFLVVDLDDLRKINSELGHPEGDRALRAIADCMRGRFRKSDIIGRIGGDEFVALLRNVPEQEQLQLAISGFMHRLGKVKIGPKNDRLVRVSVGGALGTAGVDDYETLYHQADLALYYVKAMGKNAFKLYEPELEKREFCYQPQSTVTLAEAEWNDSPELKRLLHAVTAYCPLVISANLTQNTYCIMEYKTFKTQKAKEDGSYDQLIQDGASTFHSGDREGFLRCFLRENLLRAYQEGERMVEHEGRQLGDDGIYRISRTVAILSEDEETGDICEISFTHVFSSAVKGAEEELL